MHRNILLKNGLLIDGTGTNEGKHTSIGIIDGKIAAIYDNDTQLIEHEYQKIVELNGLTILPGFINAHVHAGFKHCNGKILRDFQTDYLAACLKEGVTTIRDEGMLSDDSLEDVVNKKKILDQSGCYPRIVITGKFFSAPGGYGGMEPISVSTLEEACTKVDEVLDSGIDMIKTVLEDGLDPSTFGLPKLSDDVLKAIYDQAHLRGVKVSAHVTQAHNLERLVAAGIDDAGHMVYDHLSDELIHKMIEKNIYVVPTLTVLKMIEDKYGAPLLESGKKNVFRFVELGGKIGLGDDFLEEELPWYRLGMPRMELKLLKEAGLTNMQILVAATKHGAEICQVNDVVGTVEVGKLADLLIVEGNPVEELDAVCNVVMVVKDGVVVGK